MTYLAMYLLFLSSIFGGAKMLAYANHCTCMDRISKNIEEMEMNQLLAEAYRILNNHHHGSPNR
jgi:hypothetical protein